MSLQIQCTDTKQTAVSVKTSTSDIHFKLKHEELVSIVSVSSPAGRCVYLTMLSIAKLIWRRWYTNENVVLVEWYWTGKMWHWWNGTGQGKCHVLGGKSPRVEDIG